MGRSARDAEHIRRVLPRKKRRPHLKSTGNPLDNQGRFTLESIPPGDYKLFAWQAMERGAYLDPEFPQQFEDLGKAVSLKEGASMSVQLDAIPAE